MNFTIVVAHPGLGALRLERRLRLRAVHLMFSQRLLAGRLRLAARRRRHRAV